LGKRDFPKMVYFSLMKQRTAILLLFFLAVFIIFLNYLAVTYSLYWQIRGFDKIVHTLSGVFIGITYCVLFGKYEKVGVGVFLTSLSVGFFWEYTELMSKVMSSTDSGYLLDTSIDLFCDVAGALVGSFWFRQKVNTIKQ